jgi:hypothetical protein
MMVEWIGEIAYRIAVGRAHFDAVMHAGPVQKVVHLE